MNRAWPNEVARRVSRGMRGTCMCHLVIVTGSGGIGAENRFARFPILPSLLWLFKSEIQIREELERSGLRRLHVRP